MVAQLTRTLAVPEGSAAPDEWLRCITAIAAGYCDEQQGGTARVLPDGEELAALTSLAATLGVTPGNVLARVTAGYAGEETF